MNITGGGDNQVMGLMVAGNSGDGFALQDSSRNVLASVESSNNVNYCGSVNDVSADNVLQGVLCASNGAALQLSIWAFIILRTGS